MNAFYKPQSGAGGPSGNDLGEAPPPEPAVARGRALSAAAVRDAIIQALGDRAGEPDDWSVEGPLIRARQGEIYRALTPLAAWPLAVKVFTVGAPAQHVERQAAVLARYHAALSDGSGLSVPAAWAALPDRGMLLMQWIDAPRLDRLLWQAGPRRARRAQLIAAAGRWLRHFHEHSAMDVQPLRTADLPERLGALVAQRQGRRPDAVFRRAYETVCRLAPAFAGAPIEHVDGHGDFVPHNLLHGPNCTVALDLNPRPNAPAAQDMFRFLIQAEVEKPFFTLPGALAPCGLDKRDRDAFLDAYGPLSRPADDPVMHFLLLVQVSRHWRKLISRRRLNPLARMKAVRLRRIAAHAMAALERRPD